jgi:hypothetical protein
MYFIPKIYTLIEYNIDYLKVFFGNILNVWIHNFEA